jgi:hypothetical protein
VPRANNWQLYVTEVNVGEAAGRLAELFPSLPEPEAGRQRVALKLTLENISGSWVTLPYGRGLSGGLLDSGGNQQALIKVDFAPYTQLEADQDIYLAPGFQVSGLAWAETPQNRNPTDVWLFIDDNNDGQAEATLGVNLAEAATPPPMFDAVQLPISPPGTVFDFPNDIRATIMSLQLEPASGGQFRARLDLRLENTSPAVITPDAGQFVTLWGVDQTGRYFCCMADEAGQGGGFGIDKKLPPGQSVEGYLVTWPFTPAATPILPTPLVGAEQRREEHAQAADAPMVGAYPTVGTLATPAGSTTTAGSSPAALMMITIRGSTNAVTQLFLAKEKAAPGSPASPAATFLRPAAMNLSEANGVAVVGNTAYLTDRTGLRLWDVTNPALPQELGFYPAEGASGMVVDGAVAYLLAGGQLHLVDISDPAAPRRIGLYSLPDGARYLAVASQKAYLGAGQAGLIILDISDPVAIRELSRSAGDIGQVAVLGSTVYAVDSVDGLRLFDVSDPAQPHLLGAFRPDEPITDLIVAPSPLNLSDPLVYLGTLGQGVRIVNAIIPSGPQMIGVYSAPGSVYSLALEGTRLYVANGWGASGLSVVDITNPAAPTELSFIPTVQNWDSFVDMAVVPRPGKVNVFIANRFEGLLVYADAQ